MLNDPLSLVDPLGLDDCWSWGACTPATDNGGGGGGGWDSIYNGGSMPHCNDSPQICATGWDNIEAEQEARFSPFEFQFQGMLYGKYYNETFATWDQYADWQTGIAALPESQVYAASAVICQNQG